MVKSETTDFPAETVLQVTVKSVNVSIELDRLIFTLHNSRASTRTNTLNEQLSLST